MEVGRVCVEGRKAGSLWPTDATGFENVTEINLSTDGNGL